MTSLAKPHISIDLWDTILRRKCHPDEVKLHTAQHMKLLLRPYKTGENLTTIELLARRQAIEAAIGSRCRAEGFDDEYEIEEVLSQCILDYTQKAIPEDTLSQLTHLLVQSEINQEISVTYLDEDLIQLLKSCKYKQLHIVSDFYMSADKVEKILLSHAFPFQIDTLFLSCDSKLNKRSGRLFKHLCSKLCTKPESILHIGDNSFADIEMAEKSGVHAYHFTGNEGHTASTQNRAVFESRMQGSIRTDTLLIKKPVSPLFFKGNLDSEQARLYNYGKYFSPLFTGFALFIQERCYTKGHKTAHFFTREGKFFQRIFDRVQKHNLYEMPPVESRLLPVSRLATFFPSLKSLTPQELMRLWSQYHTQSVNSFLRSLGEDPREYQSSIRECHIDPEEMIHEPWKNTSFTQLLTNKKFLHILQKNHQIKKEQLINFFHECDFGKDGQSLVVDIGWRGTIQDNIAHIFPDINIDGCYLGLQKFFNAQPENTRKYAYIADGNTNEHHIMLRHVMPFEMLCFGTGGSATGYKLTNSGKMTPVYQCDPEEDRIHNERIHHFQEGVIAGVGQVCNFVHQHGISLQELRIEANQLATDFLNNPPIELCRAFCALKQDDTFGMARTIFPGESSFRLSDRILTYVSPARRARLLADLESSGWPQGLLCYQYFGIFHLLGKLRHKISTNISNIKR